MSASLPASDPAASVPARRAEPRRATETRLGDIQAIARRTALKQRDDPDAGVVILVLARTAHNRATLREHREALRSQFPLEGAAIARALRHGEVPPASGIILLWAPGNLHGATCSPTEHNRT